MPRISKELVWDKFINSVVDHLVGTILLSLLALLGLLERLTNIKPFSKLILPFLVWRWSGWMVLAFVVVSLLIRNVILKTKKRSTGIIQKPPKYHASYDREIQEREFSGVIWRIVVGSYVDPSKTGLTKEQVFAWPFPSAYCPECDYELERKKKSNWWCMPCRKNYKIPRELQENMWDKVRRNYQRLIVQWGYNNFGIGKDDHKPTRVVLRDLERSRKKDSIKNIF